MASSFNVGSPNRSKQKEKRASSKEGAGKTANPANEPAVIHLQSKLKRITDKLGSTTEEDGARGRRLLFSPRKFLALLIILFFFNSNYQNVPHQMFVYKKAISSLRKYPLMIQSKGRVTSVGIF
jgi:hypothetical protein